MILFASSMSGRPGADLKRREILPRNLSLQPGL